VWSIGGIIFIGDNRSSRRKACLSAALSTTVFAWSGLRSIPGLCGERPATNRLSHGTALCSWQYYYKFACCHYACSTRNKFLMPFIVRILRNILIRTYMRTCINPYIHTYVHIYIHTYIHIRRYINAYYDND